ncbi:uncharacterized protein LOC143033223 isoform X2 [Oratosquilla oratoria]|uniref:uncharacterized protein LOC143033223 isoform X2 n=1 Tax=Oratosquilla oratoria TaxID=337810 RepID=UPI003F773B98
MTIRIQNLVTDMAACLGIITILERVPITRDVLETTRLGKHINDIRRKTTNQELSRRAKDLVKKWRNDILAAEGVNGSGTSGPGPGHGNGHPTPPAGQGGHPGSLRSPQSQPSSANTSPGMSRPTTPSTLTQRTRTASPTVLSSRSQKPISPALTHNTRGGCLVSPGIAPRSPAITPPQVHTNKPRSCPQSPALAPSGVRQPQRADSNSSYAPNAENVARTNVANKRLRKDEDDSSSDVPATKRPRNFVANGFDDECSRDSFSSATSGDIIPKVPGAIDSNKDPNKIRRHGRSKKLDVSQNVDPLKPKMAALAAKAPKVKTTSQLVAELAERKGDTKLADKATKIEEQVKEHMTKETVDAAMNRRLGGGHTVNHDHEVSLNKLEHMERFLKSQIPHDVEELEPDSRTASPTQSSPPDSPMSRSVEDSTPPVPYQPPIFQSFSQVPSNLELLGVTDDETAEEILARLPPIDINSIVWDDDTVLEEEEEEVEECDEKNSLGIICAQEENEVERIVKNAEKIEPERIEDLHSKNLDSQNGNIDNDGKFREWHELLTQKAYQSDPLIILPYVITDY